MYRNNWEVSRARASEARSHNSRHTFIEPEALLHLISVQKNFLQLKQLVEEHWKAAELEQGGGYSDRDLWLWSQGLGWHSQD